MVERADLIVLGNADERFRGLVEDASHGKQIVDLVGFMSHTSRNGSEGICW
ncbi:GDP-mannose 6-dehydrogenase [compost metagenome]